MKKALAFILVLATVITLLSIPVFAADADENPLEGISEFISNAGDFLSSLPENLNDILSDLGSTLSDIKSISDAEIEAPDLEAIEDGGIKVEETANGDSTYENLNKTISQIYNITYPIGFVVMLLSWSFGIAKSNISATLDIKDRGSIVRAVLNLMVGLIAVAMAPQILTVLSGASNWLYDIIWEQSFPMVSVDESISLKTFLISDSQFSKSLLVTITLIFLQFLLLLNTLWIALLQSVSPIFIGCFGSEGTKKIALNFVKEYFKAMLVPAVTLIYFILAFYALDEYEGAINLERLIAAIVLGISTISIASKKLDKLIN